MISGFSKDFCNSNSDIQAILLNEIGEEFKKFGEKGYDIQIKEIAESDFLSKDAVEFIKKLYNGLK